tara:strand:- start:2654 stop:3235 length:582 start_codon:yes stop_codon:yes gene_type:complete
MSKALHIDKAVDSNLKPVKDSDGSLTALEISTDKVRTKSLDVIGDVNVVGEVKASSQKLISVINTGFYGNSSKMYIPLNGYVFEKTATSSNNEFVAMPAPYSGKVLKVIARSEAACGSTVVGFHKSTEGTEVPNTTATSEVTVSMTNDDTTFTFDFTNLDNTFGSGDIMAFSFDPTNSSFDTNVVVVLEYEVI